MATILGLMLPGCPWNDEWLVRTWELVVDPETKTILHFLFKRG